jgi:phosphoglycolate phosphatase
VTRLAVFDCDGTLVDGQANIVRAIAVAFGHHGLRAPTSHEARRIVGLSPVEAMAVLSPDPDPALHRALSHEFKAEFHRMRMDRTLDPEPLYPGVAEGLAALEAAGWLLGVATGKSDRGLAITLASHGIERHFITLQTADRHPSKPHPAMLRAALAEAGAEPFQAVMIGDTQFDMAMAMAAGVRGHGVSWGYHEPDELRAAGAAGLSDSFPDLVAHLLSITKD